MKLPVASATYLALNFLSLEELCLLSPEGADVVVDIACSAVIGMPLSSLVIAFEAVMLYVSQNASMDWKCLFISSLF